MNAEALGAWLATRGAIWQFTLLSPDELSRFTSDRAVRFGSREIEQLWQIGMLRADLIRSHRKLRRVGLKPTGIDDQGRYVYLDMRPRNRRRKGWIDAAASLRSLPDGVELLFHPFRFYVLLQIQRMLDLGVSPMQPLIGIERMPKLVDRVVSSLNRRLGTSSFTRVQEWNDEAALAIATEPCEYERIFGMRRRPWNVEEDEQKQLLVVHRADLSVHFRATGLECIVELHKKLCFAAASLDRNAAVQTMLRFSSLDRRMSIKGHLGGAMLIRTMAETLRRFAEEVFSTEFPEEDEIGFGQWTAGMREQLFGAHRLVDGGRAVRNEFLRQWGLDQGVRTRWYVAGKTEFGALSKVFGGDQPTGIEIINLHGAVAQRGGRGVAFSENLRLDLNAGIFSLVSIDGDVSDNLRVVRAAAQRDEVCGQFYIAQPDFEFANFTFDELEQVLWQVAIENGAMMEEHAVLHDALEGIADSTRLFNAAKRALPVLRHVSKSEDWGARLIAFALAHPELPDGATRPVVESIRIAVRGNSASYRWTRLHKKVNPVTGMLEDREDLEVKSNSQQR
ncbi:MAG: hypothetical protein AB7R89_06860 [Dehalococcoidia bacterium]